MKIKKGKIQKFFDENFGLIRSFVDETETIWFAGIDIAMALGYKRPADAIADHIKEKHKMQLNLKDLSESIEVGDSPTSKNSDKGGARRLTFIDESAVYKLIARSNMPKAEEFQDWVFEDVLPKIRKHGIYIDEDHDEIRSYGINVRRVEGRVIAHLIKYAKDQYNIDITTYASYGRLTKLANTIAEIGQDDRDNAKSINLVVCLTIEACMAVTINRLIANGESPFDIIEMTIKTIYAFLEKIRDEDGKRHETKNYKEIDVAGISNFIIDKYAKVAKKYLFDVFNTL